MLLVSVSGHALSNREALEVAMRSVPLFATIAIAACACVSSEVEALGLQPAAASEQPSQYRAERQAYLTIELEQNVRSELSVREYGIGLQNCIGPDAYGWDHRPNTLSQIAQDAAYLEALLRGGNIAEGLWRQDLATFEERMLARFARQPGWSEDYQQARDAFATELSAKLNRELPPGSPKVDNEPGCGAGEMKFEISTQPRNAELYLIPRFNTLICEGRGIDPFDRVRCPGWRPVGAPSVEHVVGDYHYLARWPGGQTSRGELRFREDREDQEVVITPRGPSFRQQPR